MSCGCLLFVFFFPPILTLLPFSPSPSPLPSFPSRWPLTCVTLNRSFFYPPSFHSLSHFKTFLTSPLHLHSSLLSPPPRPLLTSYLPFFSPRQWAHPGSLGPLKCIISSKRYPSALTSVLAGCLPSPLNGLINPSWFLDGLDFIVSHSPLSSCSSLFLNVILSDFNMSAFSEHTAFDYIELWWQGPARLLLSLSPCWGNGGVGVVCHLCKVNHRGCEAVARSPVIFRIILIHWCESMLAPSYQLC